jgi:hypothetical protein
MQNDKTNFIYVPVVFVKRDSFDIPVGFVPAAATAKTVFKIFALQVGADSRTKKMFKMLFLL